MSDHGLRVFYVSLILFGLLVGFARINPLAGQWVQAIFTFVGCVTLAHKLVKRPPPAYRDG